MDEIILADGIRIGRCDDPECKCIHFLLVDERDNGIACASIPISHGKEFIKDIQDMIYAVAVLKGDG